jgi:phosphoribosylformimino-5-aminoimidazole carboxamide ribotide isomerase
MVIYPAIDLYDGKAVRLFKGDYAQMTVYSDDPAAVARDFKACGADHIHLVDLAGAKSGKPENLATIASIIDAFGGFVEVGGGIRDMDTVAKYIEIGVNRVILGTAAVKDPAFLQAALDAYGDKIAVGVDIKDGKVAIKGWLETAEDDAMTFCEKMQKLGVKTIISTDISKDGAMMGANHSLYREMAERFDMQIVASGGVSSMDDVTRLRPLDIYGAII